MIDDLALILTSVGAASCSVALLRRRARRVSSPPFHAGAGARHLVEALSAAATEPLPIAAPTWKSLAETLEPEACERLS
jgi:hypothetical protein